jgi:hypothetical protein
MKDLQCGNADLQVQALGMWYFCDVADDGGHYWALEIVFKRCFKKYTVYLMKQRWGLLEIEESCEGQATLAGCSSSFVSTFPFVVTTEDLLVSCRTEDLHIHPEHKGCLDALHKHNCRSQILIDQSWHPRWSTRANRHAITTGARRPETHPIQGCENRREYVDSECESVLQAKVLASTAINTSSGSKMRIWQSC